MYLRRRLMGEKTIHYIKFLAASSGLSIYLYISGTAPNFEYSLDLNTWSTLSTTAIPFTTIYIRGMNTSGLKTDLGTYIYFKFGSDSIGVTVSGNIMSLINYENPPKNLSEGFRFGGLFRNAKCLTDASELELPAKILSDYCYNSMFFNCTSLVNPPKKLPALTLTTHCYYEMFKYCTSLITTPELPATTLSDYCYYNMFALCTSLTTFNSFNATTLADYCCLSMFWKCTSLVNIPKKLPALTAPRACYYQMFFLCSSLTTAPDLPATTLSKLCYYKMFNECTSLVTIPTILPATTLAEDCYGSMFDTTAIVTAPKLPATTLAYECYQNMFATCKKLTTAPELPATTLAPECYWGMFRGCRALTKAPVLPALNLETLCYFDMFENCSNLNYIKAMFITDPDYVWYTSGSSTYYYYTGEWVVNVSYSGTFVKNSAATWTLTGVGGIPANWTVTTASS